MILQPPTKAEILTALTMHRERLRGGASLIGVTEIVQALGATLDALRWLIDKTPAEDRSSVEELKLRTG